MDAAKVIKQHKKICSLVAERRIKQSLDLLSDMIASATPGLFSYDYENLVMTYRNMLAYTIDGIADPERGKVYLKLMQSILGLSDRVRQDILSQNSGWHTYWVKQQAEKEMKLSGKTIAETVDELAFKPDLDEWLGQTAEISPDPESELSLRHRKLIKDIFNHLWLTDYYGDAEKSLISLISKTGRFLWHEASIFTTAITLSALRTCRYNRALQGSRQLRKVQGALQDHSPADDKVAGNGRTKQEDA
ncbi:MAG: hypothetical protein MUD02_11275 [Bacteroidales bacterium]|nr:hypothetical protein [Bacteroidales bacterium]